MERMRNQEKNRENVKKWRKENREKYNEYTRNYWMGKRERIKQLEEENKKLKEEKEFFYKSAKQFREQVEKWEKDFVE
jgi:hypothetical protein